MARIDYEVFQCMECGTPRQSVCNTHSLQSCNDLEYVTSIEAIFQSQLVAVVVPNKRASQRHTIIALSALLHCISSACASL